MWFSLVGISAFFYLSTKSLAGHYTFADIGIKVMGDFKISEAFSYLFGAGGVGYGLRSVSSAGKLRSGSRIETQHLNNSWTRIGVRAI
jgi:hypothetical protein